MALPTESPEPNEQNRFIPPIINEVLEQKTVETWDNDDSLNTKLIENDDGSVDIPNLEDTKKANKFVDNLAEHLKDSELTTIATNYLDLIEKDLESRSKRDEQYEEGIRRTGLGDDAPGGAQFAGASRVVHPVLAEGCVDFAARAIKELCPPNGPVKTQIFGKAEGKKLQKATRKRNFLNWQLTKQCPEFFTELEQMLSQLPLGGSQYIKVLPNQKQRRPEFEFVPIDKMLVPFAATSFYQAQRATHIQELTEQTFNKRVDSGYYRDIDIISPDEPTQSKSEIASNKIEGKEADTYNDDGLRTVYEMAVYAEFDFDDITDGELAPYIVILDASMSTVLAIYRNWDETDGNQSKLDWIVEFKFIPWRGAYAIGLPHLIGGLAAALTGALRALMDSAHINNAPTALKMKGARLNGANTTVDVGNIQEIEGAPGIDDIRRIIMPMPFNPPSPVLFQLLDWLTGAAKGVVSTAEERIADATNQMPVGTALALIEQGSITYSAIHMRLHNSMAKLLEIVCRIDYDLLDEEEVREELGEEIIYREDFNSSTDIVPVSDPNIFSESQRYAQIQAVMQLAETGKASGVEYNMQEVHRRALELMKVNDIEGILPIKPKPIEINALAENVSMMLGNEIIVFPAQDHLSHIEAHLRFANDPNFGGSSLMAGNVLPQALEHIAQHIAFLYADTCNSVANSVAPLGTKSVDPKQMDQLLAAVSAQVSTASQQVFAPIQQLLAEVQQKLQAAQPQPPLDPAIQVQKDIGMAEIDRQKAKDAGELQIKDKIHTEGLGLDTQKHQLQAQKDLAAAQTKMEELRLKTEDLTHKAQIAQETLDLNSKKQDLEYQIKMGDLKRKEQEFAQLQASTEQARITDAQVHLQTQAQVPTENVPDPRIEMLIEAQQGIMDALKELSQPKEDDSTKQLMLAVLAQLTKPKTISVTRDARGRATGMEQE